MSRQVHPPELFGPPTADDFVMLEEDLVALCAQQECQEKSGGHIRRLRTFAETRYGLPETDCAEAVKEILVSGEVVVCGMSRTLKITKKEVYGQRTADQLKKVFEMELEKGSIGAAFYSSKVLATHSKAVKFVCDDYLHLMGQFAGEGIRLRAGDCKLLHEELRELRKL